MQIGEWEMKRLFLTWLASLILIGCSSTLIIPSYFPKNYTNFSGKVIIGDFLYEPFMIGKVKSNQIQNTAIGETLLSSDVSNIVKIGTELELKKTGITFDSGNLKLTGIIKEFKLDDLGLGVDFTYIINYKLIDINTSNVLLDKEYLGDKMRGTNAVPIDLPNAVNDMIASGYNKFITDPDVRKILEKK